MPLKKISLHSLSNYLPIFAVLLVMLPRLLSPQFGFFDDAVMIETSDLFQRGEWSLATEAGHGRFRPVYWLYYALIYGLAGKHALSFFLGNTLLFILITACLIRLVLQLGGDRYQAWFAGITFVLAGPNLENVYTLSKPELLQTLWMAISLLVAARLFTQPSRSSKVLGLILASIFVALACATKETAGLLLPIAFAWLMVNWFFVRLRVTRDRTRISHKLFYFIGVSLGIAVFLIFRRSALPFGLLERGYPSQFDFGASRIVDNARIWLDLLLMDYLYMAPLATIPLIWIVLRKWRSQVPMITESLIWVILWIAIYIPWVYTQEYYLMPFAFGAAILGSTLLGLNRSIFKLVGIQWKTAISILLSATAILFVLTLPNFVTNARLQLAVDAANTEMLQYVLEHAPANSDVWINIQEPNEYVASITTYVEGISDRGDLAVDYFRFQDPLTEGNPETDLYVLSPIVDNQFYPSMRMGVFEHYAKEWGTSMKAFYGDSLELEFITEHSFRSFNIDSMRLICPLARSLEYCDVANTPFDRRVFAYGWEVYKVTTNTIMNDGFDSVK